MECPGTSECIQALQCTSNSLTAIARAVIAAIQLLQPLPLQLFRSTRRDAESRAEVAGVAGGMLRVMGEHAKLVSLVSFCRFPRNGPIRLVWSLLLPHVFNRFILMTDTFHQVHNNISFS